MSYSLPKRVEHDLIQVAQKCGISKMTLFGSRARGDNSDRSDIDIAVSGGDFTKFYYDVEEDVWTLLSFDIVNMDNHISDELRLEIERDGVVLYEKI